jgi:anaerobic nitric oxide reductase flavorubredoxin
MAAQQIAKGIYWVGAVDWDIRYFHGQAYSTHRGTTYNAYLFVDEKIALVDTVYSPFTEQLIENIREIVEPSKIDYIISNHSESDHSGALPRVKELAPDAKIFCTEKGAEFLEKHYAKGWKYEIVHSLDELKLGERTLTFLEAPMLHWPDSMFTYIKEDAILMPNDAFGQHIATSKRFDDEVNMNEVMEEAAKYYANILTPFSKLVAKKLEEVAALGIPIKMICPSHGIIFRQQPGAILEAYKKWSTEAGGPAVVIAYDTMWESTAMMAKAIGDGIASEGVPFRSFRLSKTDRNDVIKEVLAARAILVGSPTINRGLLPTVAPLLDDLAGLKPLGKLAAAFGSDGWSGGSVQAISNALTKAGFKLVSEGLTVKWVPSADELGKLKEFGRSIAQAVKEGAE